MIKGSVVLVPFPFDDFSASKVRPAVCLSNPIGKYQHVIVSFVSSNIEGEILDSDILLSSNHTEFFKTGLKRNSIIKTHKVVTIPKKNLQRKLVHLPESVLTQIQTNLKIIFGLDS